jgi:hypothetical protein
MSNEVSNADIYNVLINMRGDLGRLEGKVDGHANTLKTHIDDDKVTHAALVASVQKVQVYQARQRGFITAVSAIGGTIGAGVVYLLKLIVGGHS